jgi:hypothetical protein
MAKLPAARTGDSRRATPGGALLPFAEDEGDGEAGGGSLIIRVVAGGIAVVALLVAGFFATRDGATDDGDGPPCHTDPIRLREPLIGT